MVKSVSTLRELRLVLETWRQRDETIGFVPTMGALHDGHLALIRQAQNLSTRVVTSIFVNPLQFGNDAEMETYPRRPEKDEHFLTDNGCDLLFSPTADSMYPFGFSTQVDPGPIGQIWEGVFRPSHFIGVATVMVKLLLQVMPDYVFLGEKDYQQLQVIDQIVRDLHIPVSIIPVPIQREPDGLPASNQNVFLSAEERSKSIALPRVLQTAVDDIRNGHDIEATLSGGTQQLEIAGLQVDYFELVDAHTLSPARDLKKPTRIIAAARIGKTRLIDNMAV
ncbi:MAG: pantoate--beta-alanine ligase [Alphaproteobacteria bacterium]|nr:pantoate--beta-alanine ligase [Alphaproteobacteria bacterium]